MRNASVEGRSVLDQSYDLLEYLSAVAREIGPKPVRDVRSHPFTLWPEEVPEMRAVAVGAGGDRTTWLEVARVPAPEPAPSSAEIADLLQDRRALSNPELLPQLSQSALEQQVEAVVSQELTEAEALDGDDVAANQDGQAAVDDDPVSDTDDSTAVEREERAAEIRHGLEVEFHSWIENEWTPWAAKARPIMAARKLYARLYELHLIADTESATHEVVWGHFVLSCRTGEGPVVAPLLTTTVIVQIDPDDATIRIAPEQPVELELNAVEGTGLTGIDALVALQGAMRAAPPDPWSSEERRAVRGQLIAPLGIDASLYESPSIAPITNAPRVNDGWVLFMRKRPLRQERFYDELAHKIQDENFLPEALASVVADKDRVDSALTTAGRELVKDDGTADRLMMPLPANAEQERIARQLAQARGVTVQGPPGTGKSHTIVNLVSHLVAQGKRVLVTAEKEQALSVLREKIPERLRDLSIAVLGSTPAAMEELRSAAQSMQDSLSAIDAKSEQRRIAELGATIDSLRQSLVRIDAALVEALRSEQREYRLPDGPARAPEVAEWLATNRHLDLIQDRVPDDAPPPITPAELGELADLLHSVSAEEAQSAVLDLPVEEWLPSTADLGRKLERLDLLRDRVTALEEGGLLIDSLEGLSQSDLHERGRQLRMAAATMRNLDGEWETRFASATRNGSPASAWVIQHNAGVRAKLVAARELANLLAGHVLTVPDGNPVEQLKLTHQWSERVSAGRKIGWLAAKDLKEFSSQVQVDGYPVSTLEHLDLVRAQIELRAALREVHTLMTQAYGPCLIPVPEPDASFLFAAEDLAGRVDKVWSWWSGDFPALKDWLSGVVANQENILSPVWLESIADMIEGAAARLEERQLSQELDTLSTELATRRATSGASPLWSELLSALQMARPDQWDLAIEEARRLFLVRAKVLRSDELIRRIDHGGAPRWARAILDTRGDRTVIGEAEEFPTSWERAKARAWLAALHSQTDIESLMDRSHEEARALRGAIIDMASRSARVQLKSNLKDRQRRALETWLTAVKRVGKGTGKNAPRFQAAAREALPAAMGAVPIWIMPIYRVMENFDPSVSDLFDVVIVDESSQCDLLSLGVLALGKKAVVVGDDKQTTPERVGIQTERIASLQDQHLRDLPDAKLLTLDESLYSISARAFPSTIALREHFRCVPEIIGFSNRYYQGSIQPLREVGVPQIGDPLKVVRLADAVSLQGRSGRVNEDEAVAIADQIAACVEDPAYDGLTFGVVTMMSGPQAQIVQDYIRDRIGDEEFERRRLRVGNPPLFQGDERNVMFISMVAHDNSFAATAPRYAQWANVAVSRAQDQLWVFYSMDPSTLHHEDQRRAIIEYAQSYGRRQETESLFELTESKFERDVLKQILERGFDVIPQHRVGSYRIDFVVRVAPGERLAVECDGDSFHGPEKWDDDVRRQRVLERLGWSFWRVRASAYYLDPDAAMKPLWRRLEEMRVRAAEAEAVIQARHEAAEKRRLEELKRAASVASDPRRESETAPDAEATPPPEPAESAAAVGLQSQRTAVNRGGNANSAQEHDPARIRQWAHANGYSLGRRGRIPREIVSAYFEAQRHMRSQTSTVVPDVFPSSRSASPLGSGEEEAPSKNEMERVWRYGHVYHLVARGDVVERDSGRTLASVIGNSRAAAIRDRMLAIRPQGGRFKVGKSGAMVTRVDGELVFVTWVSKDEWFPSHLIDR